MYPLAVYNGNGTPDLLGIRFKISCMSEAVWALKAIFYSIDHGNVGFVQVEDILTALSDSRWPATASISEPPPLRQAIGGMGAITAPHSELNANEDTETLLNRLRQLGVGVKYGGGGCDTADLVHYIRRLLAPPVSLGAVIPQQNRRSSIRLLALPAFLLTIKRPEATGLGVRAQTKTSAEHIVRRDRHSA